METSYKKPKLEELHLSAVRYDKKISHQVYILGLEAKTNNKVKIILYQSTAENAQPTLVFWNVLGNIQFSEKMKPQCLVDEVAKKLYIVCHNINNSLELTIMEIPIKYDVSNRMSICGASKVYTEMAEYRSFDNHKLFLHPADGSIMRHVELKSLFSFFGHGIRSEFRIEWFQLNADTSTMKLATTKMAENKLLFCKFLSDWAAIQFCHNGSTLITMYVQMADYDFKEGSNAQFNSDNPTFTGGYLPDFAIFSLDVGSKTVTLIRSLPVVHNQSPAILKNYIQHTKLMDTCIKPIGQAYKYNFFHFFPKQGTVLFNSNIQYMLIAIKCLYKSIKDFGLTSNLSSYARIRYSTPFFPNGKPYRFQKSSEKVDDDLPRAIEFPHCIDGQLISIVKDSDSDVKRISLDLSSYKDYRKCAACGTIEKKKRKNKSGERISCFKVCRICKELNFHWQWWNYPCRYCSLECIAVDWPRHKKIHDKPKLLVKIAETVNLDEIEPEKLKK